MPMEAKQLELAMPRVRNKEQDQGRLRELGREGEIERDGRGTHCGTQYGGRGKSRGIEDL